MATIKISGVEREITFRKLTRAEARQIEEISMAGLNMQAGMKPEDIVIPAVNALRAAELEIMFTSGLTRAELDAMGDDEYQALKKEADVWIAESKKK